MKAQITYISHYFDSITQSDQAIRSFDAFKNWEVEKTPGVTPETVKSQFEYNIPIKENSRLLDFKKEDTLRYLTKLSCVINHVKFFKRVIAADEPMVFLEHDALCTRSWVDVDFDEYLILNAEYVFKPPNKLALRQYKDYVWPGTKGVYEMQQDYRLTYYRDNNWNGSFMAPGTGAYALTPKGAKRLLAAAEKNLDQSDFLINSYNVNMQYLLPSPIKFNSVNLSTSYGIQI